MSAWASAIYSGVVTHRRFAPRAHFLRYRLFMLLLDLDELPALGRSLRLFSHNRPGLLSFHDADHGDGSGPLRPQIEAHLAAAGLPTDGPIRLLCLPRVLGYVFNPLSVYFCHDAEGRLAAVLYEVSNTFGDRHSYLIPAEGDGPLRQACGKRLHVSPFLDMDLAYDFRIAAPGDRVSLHIDVGGAGGRMLSASFGAARRSLSDAALLRAWLAHPLLTLKVTLGIHWEALRLWLKGVGYRPRPPAPAAAVTVVRQPG